MIEKIWNTKPPFDSNWICVCVLMFFCVQLTMHFIDSVMFCSRQEIVIMRIRVHLEYISDLFHVMMLTWDNKMAMWIIVWDEFFARKMLKSIEFLFCSGISIIFFCIKDREKLIYSNFISHSTREIKPNQTDIGRKVKVKTSMQRLSNIPTNNNATLNKRDSSWSSSSSNYVDSSSNPSSWINQLETSKCSIVFEYKNWNCNLLEPPGKKGGWRGLCFICGVVIKMWIIQPPYWSIFIAVQPFSPN